MNGSQGTIGISVNASDIDLATWDGSMHNSGSTQTSVGVANNLASKEPSGDIDELAVWNGRVFTSGDIAALYNGGVGVNLGSVPIANVLRRRRRLGR